MDTTITLDQRHFKAAVARARKLGTTTEVYIQSLIDAATTDVDQLLAPAREAFRRGGSTEAELETAVNEARKAIQFKRSRR